MDIELIDIDDLTNDLTIHEQLDYIFDYVDNRIIRNDFKNIDESINIFIKNGIDFDIDVFVGFLVICKNFSDNLKNYNKLYNETYFKCKKTMDDFETKQVLSGLKRNDFDEWVRSRKVNNIVNKCKK